MVMIDSPLSYIWQRPDWPEWRYELRKLMPLLSAIHRETGVLEGRMHEVGFDVRRALQLSALSDEVLKSNEIEGEKLDKASVRSSITRRLGIDLAALPVPDRYVDGMVAMMLDATTYDAISLTAERLKAWQSALFPTGYSGILKITIGEWRDDHEGPMQVVSGPIERRKVHFEAPPAALLADEIKRFLVWFNTEDTADPLIRAGLAHLWFITLHPFDDGNGRVARAIGDRALSQAEQTSIRYYSFSAQIQREREGYYAQLERAQKGDMEVTAWLEWFLGCLLRAVQSANAEVSVALAKARYWGQWSSLPLSERQIRLMNRLLDGFEGKLTTTKWAAIAKCSHDTALRDIQELMKWGVLIRSESGGRSASYELNNKKPDPQDC
jgi:Fic family protein